MATRAHFASLDALGTPVNAYDDARATEYLTASATRSPSIAARAAGSTPRSSSISRNRRSRSTSGSARGSTSQRRAAPRRARVGETLATRGRVRSLFEKKDRQFVEADLAIVAETGGRPRPVAHVLHTAIYCLASC